MNNNTTNSRELMMRFFHTRVYVIVVPMLILLCLAAVIINSYILAIGCTLKRRLNIVLKLTFGLAAADVYASLAIGCAFLMNSLLSNSFDKKMHGCIVLMLECVRLGAITTSILHLVLLALHHYFSITRPHVNPMTDKTVNILMILSWLVPPVSFCIIFSMTKHGFREPTSCNGTRMMDSLYFRLAFFLFIVIALAVMITLYLLMQKELYSVEQKMMAGKLDSNRSNPKDVGRKNISKKRRAMTTTMVMVGTFVFGYFTVVLWFLVTANEIKPLSIDTANGVLWLGVISITLNFCMTTKFFLNPLVYAIRVPEMRSNLCLCFKSSNIGGQKRSGPDSTAEVDLKRFSQRISRSASTFRQLVGSATSKQSFKGKSTTMDCNDDGQHGIDDHSVWIPPNDEEIVPLNLEQKLRSPSDVIVVINNNDSKNVSTGDASFKQENDILL